MAISSVLVSNCFLPEFSRPGIMSSSSSNNVEDDAWLMQMELGREDAEGVTMDENEGDSLEVQPPPSERATLAGISTIPNPHQAIGTTSNHEGQEIREGLPLGGPYTGYIGTTFVIWFITMEWRILRVHISPPIGIYPVQVKVMLGKVLGGLKISIFWRKFRRM